MSTPEPDQSVTDLRRSLEELQDSINRLAAVIARNTNAVLWLAAMEEWRAEPWWSRGPVPKWPKS